MKHVSIIIPQGHASMVNIEGTHQILNMVNQFLAQRGEEPLFDVHLVGIEEVTKQSTGLFTVNPDQLIWDIEKTDLIIIPAIYGDQELAFVRNKPYAAWIVEQYNKGAEVACMCIGSFFLAGTGLLDGKQCATHWIEANTFKQMYPQVHLVDDKILTEEDRIYTSGGAYSYLNLLLYLIEKHAGRDMAILISKAFMIDIDKHSQSPFIMFQGQKTHDDDAVKQAQDHIEQNYPEKITVDQLADMVAVGRRSLERRFKKATGNTVTEYMQRVKIEAAKKNLESGRSNVTEAMYEVGYSDMKAFRTLFRKVTGLSPIEYRNRYTKLVEV